MGPTVTALKLCDRIQTNDPPVMGTEWLPAEPHIVLLYNAVVYTSIWQSMTRIKIYGWMDGWILLFAPGKRPMLVADVRCVCGAGITANGAWMDMGLSSLMLNTRY